MSTFSEGCLFGKPAAPYPESSATFVMGSLNQRIANEADLARIAEFNRTGAAFPDHSTLQELIEAQFAKCASTAVICDHDRAFGVTTLPCSELNKKANQLAHSLRAQGIGPGHIVALMVERSFAMMIGILGIIKAGAAYLPLSPDNPHARTDFMLKDAGVRVLMVHTKTAGSTTFDGSIINLDDPRIYRGPEENPVNINQPRDLAYVIYTSGSTGKPKGVMIEHRSVVNRLHWMQHSYPIDGDDVILQKTPYYFDVSVWELFWWALQGAKLCFLMPRGESNPLVIVETIRKHGVTVLHFVPSMLNVFLGYLDGKDDRVRNGLTSVRQVFVSGEALAPSHVRQFNSILGKRIGTRLTNLYGPTEATVDVSYYDCPTYNDFEKVPIGRPIHNTKLYIIRDGQQVAVGEDGELCIAGVGLARGYLNNQALTDEKFVAHPANLGERIYRTGDVARWLPDGNVEYLGREDHQVKIRGLRIELGEIENTLRDYPGIADCVCVARKYSESVTLIIAYLVCKSEVEIEGLKQYLKMYLPDYSIPNHFEILDKMPLTPSGKADRKALPEPVIQMTPR
jgi:D-alanine--poly(phosphoribitol) ligase subunit 1